MMRASNVQAEAYFADYRIFSPIHQWPAALKPVSGPGAAPPAREMLQKQDRRG
jgi:hypothetical protein